MNSMTFDEIMEMCITDKIFSEEKFKKDCVQYLSDNYEISCGEAKNIFEYSFEDCHAYGYVDILEKACEMTERYLSISSWKGVNE